VSLRDYKREWMEGQGKGEEGDGLDVIYWYVIELTEES